MNKKNLLDIILSILLVAYMIVAFSFSSYLTQNDYCTGVDITIDDPSNINFITSEDITREIGNENNRFTSMRLNEINTHKLELSPNSIDKIESANCFITKDHRLKIDITPLIPVARIFDSKESYYINREGKKMSASARYHVDVPVVVGQFNSDIQSISILPLLKYIKNDSIWNSFVAGIKIEPNNDIIIAPMLKGHVINFGDTSNIENKFNRLKTIYKTVMPVKGWSFYDTISVKWHGQVVATKKNKRKSVSNATHADSIDIEESLPVSSMDVTNNRSDDSSESNKKSEETVKSDSPKAKKNDSKTNESNSNNKLEKNKENNNKPN